MKLVFLLKVFIIFFPFFVESSSYLLCKNQKIVRTLRIIETKDSGCVTKYSKLGVEKTIAQGTVRASCEKIMMDVKNTLERGWFKCRDISDAKIYESVSKDTNP